jgi:hypothetical protein
VTDDVATLRSPRTIRARAEEALARVEAGRSEHFAVDWARLPAVADRVVAVTRAAYPDPRRIPFHSRWRHFGAGGVDRAAAFEARLEGLGELDKLRSRCELAITSVLLDAGAGPGWSFLESDSGLSFSRSEGLAVASYHLFVDGGLSSDPAVPLQADVGGLAAADEAALARAFQADARNPLVGLAGRVELLRRLGEAVRAGDAFAYGRHRRLGNLGAGLLAGASAGEIPAAAILAAVLDALGSIWPGRLALGGVPLGDVWPHPQLGLVPLHKLSQWLTYSLFEPLEAAGLRVVAAGELTGLAEYRNGGLFLDGGVLIPKHPEVLAWRHAVGDPIVVEWRALTVALLDRAAEEVRRRLGLDADALPLARVLEGGTWSAGRQIARERRLDGGPPLQVQSDGTVF